MSNTQEDAHRFETGAVRSNDRAKERWDLVSPIALREIAKTYAEGAEKRGEFNWEHGMPVTDLLNHAIAHIYDFLAGDRREPHLPHAAWNIMAAIHSLEVWPHLNEGWLRGPGCTQPPAAKLPKTAPPELSPEKTGPTLQQVERLAAVRNQLDAVAAAIAIEAEKGKQ